MYALLNSNNHDSNLRKEPNNTAFKAFKLRLMNPSAFENPNYQILFFSFLFIYEKEENALEVLTQNQGSTINPHCITARNWTLWYRDTLLALKPLWLLLFWLRPPRKSQDPL